MAVPVNSVLPVISGTVEVGYTLTATTGTWSPTPTSFTFQWQRINDSIVDIAGATNNQYIITANDTGYTLRVQVIATNNSGDSLPAISAETVTIPDDWFIVEDGTAKADAVSYATINYANDYHARRGNQAWGNLSIGEKKAAMVKSAEYLVEKYRMRWKGERVSTTQSLDWPRNWVEYADYQFITRNGAQVIGGFLYYPANEVPEEVKAAQAELAYATLTGVLYGEQGQVVKRQKVDVLEVEYDQYSFQGRRFPAVDGRLAPLLGNVRNQVVRK